MAFLHGVETFLFNNGPKSVQGVKSSVIGLVGTAPIHHVDAAKRTQDKAVLCLSDVDDAVNFGPSLDGYTIPRALSIYRGESAKFVFVINVFDPTVHKEDVAAADLDIEDDKIVLANPDLTTVVVKAAGGAGSALVEGTDYDVDMVTGIITVLAGGALDAAAQANVAYSYGDPSAVVVADVIGGVDGGGSRYGMNAFLDCGSKFGFKPKILDAPVYSTQATVVSAMASLSVATKLRAVYWADAPAGTAYAEAIAGRGPAGTINFNIADGRGMLAYPHYLANDGELHSLGAAGAGVMAFVDSTEGFWVSPSNRIIKTATGVEIPLTADIADEASEVNLLNASGITTVFNAFGTGYRLWGNRSSAFPGTSDIMTFITSQRTADQITESIEHAMMPFIDKTVSAAIIQAILDTTNNYMRRLIGRGAVPPGSRVLFEEAKNPYDQVAAGQLIFTQDWSPVPPLERITFHSVVNIKLLANLLPA